MDVVRADMQIVGVTKADGQGKLEDDDLFSCHSEAE